MYCFIAFKYVNLILWFNEIGLYFWGLGRSLITFKDLGSKGKNTFREQGIFFQGFGEINALFSGIKGAQTPWGDSLMVKSRVWKQQNLASL